MAAPVRLEPATSPVMGRSNAWLTSMAVGALGAPNTLAAVVVTAWLPAVASTGISSPPMVRYILSSPVTGLPAPGLATVLKLPPASFSNVTPVTPIL